MIRGATDEHFWSAIYDRDLRDVLALQSDVAQAIADRVQVTVSGKEHERLVAARPVSPDAYEAYLKGRYYWNKRTGDGMQKAEQYFQQAIDSDPTYAAAYSGLADCNSGLAWHGFKSPAESLPKAYAAARKAIEIDPQSAETHASLGLVLSHRWDWVDAEAEFRRALELDPRYANAHHWYGDYLSIKGRNEEALAEASRALELDPLNLMINTWVGLRYYLAHNYSAAIEQNRNSVSLIRISQLRTCCLARTTFKQASRAKLLVSLRGRRVCREAAHFTPRRSRLPLQRQAGSVTHSKLHTNWR